MKHIGLKILKLGFQMRLSHIKCQIKVSDQEENRLLHRLQKVFQIMLKNDYRK